MSFTKKADYTEAIFTALIWVSVINLIILFAQEVLKIALLVEGGSCNAQADFYGLLLMQPPAVVCAVANVTPDWVVFFAAFFFNLFFARWAWNKREYWYREVQSGVVVDRAKYRDSEGIARFRITVRGKNRMGEVRDYSRYVKKRQYKSLLDATSLDVRELQV